MIRQRFGHVLLLAAFCVFVLASTAYAECAWMLWVKVENVNFTPGAVKSDGWETESAAPTYPKSAELFELISGRYKVRWTYKDNDSLSAYWEFRCLPDTVDPRGPKAKSRPRPSRFA